MKRWTRGRAQMQHPIIFLISWAPLAALPPSNRALAHSGFSSRRGIRAKNGAHLDAAIAGNIHVLAETAKCLETHTDGCCTRGVTWGGEGGGGGHARAQTRAPPSIRWRKEQGVRLTMGVGCSPEARRPGPGGRWSWVPATDPAQPPPTPKGAKTSGEGASKSAGGEDPQAAGAATTVVAAEEPSTSVSAAAGEAALAPAPVAGGGVVVAAGEVLGPEGPRAMASFQAPPLAAAAATAEGCGVAVREPLEAAPGL